MSKSIEQAANDYAKDQPRKTECALANEHINAFLAGAKHQKELSDAREKLLLDVISDMKEKGRIMLFIKRMMK